MNFFYAILAILFCLDHTLTHWVVNNAQLLQDSEPVRLVETPRSLSEYMLIQIVPANNRFDKGGGPQSNSSELYFYRKGHRLGPMRHVCSFLFCFVLFFPERAVRTKTVLINFFSLV